MIIKTDSTESSYSYTVYHRCSVSVDPFRIPREFYYARSIFFKGEFNGSFDCADCVANRTKHIHYPECIECMACEAEQLTEYLDDHRQTKTN